jgi:hypothetical protein
MAVNPIFNKIKSDTIATVTADIIVNGTVYVGTEGDIRVEAAEGGTATYVAFKGFLPGNIHKILLNGTNAGDIVLQE